MTLVSSIEWRANLCYNGLSEDISKFIWQSRLLQGTSQYVLSQQSGRSKICASMQASCMALGTIHLMCPRGTRSGDPLHLRRQ